MGGRTRCWPFNNAKHRDEVMRRKPGSQGMSPDYATLLPSGSGILDRRQVPGSTGAFRFLRVDLEAVAVHLAVGRLHYLVAQDLPRAVRLIRPKVMDPYRSRDEVGDL